VSESSDNERLIKKYPNRRLYDTQDSRYITLDDAKQMVIENTPFKVVDQKTGEDLTRSILLQIIMEQENNNEPLFNSDILSEFIRNNSQTNRDYFSSFLQASMQLFSEQQGSLVNQMDKVFKNSPMDFWMQMTSQNLEKLTELQSKFFKTGSSEDSKK
jgi:polyhydroxyalkanoate synthesis repressor PhaR